MMTEKKAKNNLKQIEQNRLLIKLKPHPFYIAELITIPYAVINTRYIAEISSAAINCKNLLNNEMETHMWMINELENVQLLKKGMVIFTPSMKIIATNIKEYYLKLINKHKDNEIYTNMLYNKYKDAIQTMKKNLTGIYSSQYTYNVTI